MRKIMMLAGGLVLSLFGVAESAVSVTTTERIGLAYDQFGVDVTLATPGMTSAKVVLKDVQGSIVDTQVATFSGAAARVVFRDLTPGAVYRYDVYVKGDGEYAAPAGWQTVSVNLFSSVDWFGFSAGAFQKALPDEGIAISGSTYASKGETPGLVTPTVAAADGGEAVMETRVAIAGVYDWSDLPALDNDPQFALALAIKEDERVDVLANRVWAYKAGVGDWTALSSSAAPTADGEYVIRTVLDYRAGQKVVSCTLTAGSATYLLCQDVPLTAERMDWFGVIGGNVISQAASQMLTKPVEVRPTGTEIALESNSEVDLAALTEDTPYTMTDNGHTYCWKDMANRYAMMSGGKLIVCAGVPANGLESFDSYALGLDPAVALDKPAAVVKAGGMQSESGITVHVPNVMKENLPDAGVTVVHRLQRSDDKGQTWTDTGTEVGAGESLVVPFESGVLYRVNTVLK